MAPPLSNVPDHVIFSINRISMVAAWARVALPWGTRVDSVTPSMTPLPQAHWRAEMAYSLTSSTSR